MQYTGGNCTSLGPPRTGCDTIQEMYTYSTAGGLAGKRVRVIRGTAQGDLNATWTYDSEGRATGVTYPQWTNAGTTVPGSSYTYALNRLATAIGSGWGQSYTYDGFGNLTDQNVISGSAPTMHVVYNAATNRQTTDLADANGNLGVPQYSYNPGNLYDIENRLIQNTATTLQYAYDASNKRVWRGDGVRRVGAVSKASIS